MIRPASWLVAVAAAAWLALAAQPSDARADDMDLALSRLRLGDLCTELEPSLPRVLRARSARAAFSCRST